MEDTKRVKSTNIRRRNSTMSSSISKFRSRIPMKSSPYVGWFRHAPPSSRVNGSKFKMADTFSSSHSNITKLLRFHQDINVNSNNDCRWYSNQDSKIYKKEQNPAGIVRLKCPLSLHQDGKASPYVGWFRHAPPSHLYPRIAKKLSNDVAVDNVVIANIIGNYLDYTIGNENKNKMTAAAASAAYKKKQNSRYHTDLHNINHHERLHNKKYKYHVSGRLPGGGTAMTCTKNTPGNSSTSSSSSCPPHPSATFEMLTKIASWVIFPLAAAATSHKVTCKTSNSNNSDCSDRDPCNLSSAVATELSQFQQDAVWKGICFGGNNYSCDGYKGLASILMPYLSSILKKVMYIEGDCSKNNIYECNANNDDSSPHNIDPTSDADGSSYSSCSNGMDNSICTDCESEYSDYDNNNLSHISGEQKQLGEDNIDNMESVGNDDYDFDTRHPLAISISSLAQAYYTEQTCRDFVNQFAAASTESLDYSSELHSIPPPTTSSLQHHGEENCVGSAGDHQQHHYNELDYIITQQDIARMARNASRHLDVERILSLPTITYRSHSTSSEKINEGTGGEDSFNDNAAFASKNVDNVDEGKNKKDDNNEEDLGWSWITVPKQGENISIDSERNIDIEKKEDSSSSKTEEQQQYQQCIICLENFQDGDRLRVLPCQHLFHMGCIDKWLSGTYSYQECFTRGCPTCKKTPEVASAAAIQTAANGHSSHGTAVTDSGLDENQEGLMVAVEDTVECEEEVNGRNRTASQDTSRDGILPSWAFVRLGGALAKGC